MTISNAVFLGIYADILNFFFSGNPYCQVTPNPTAVGHFIKIVDSSSCWTICHFWASGLQAKLLSTTSFHNIVLLDISALWSRDRRHRRNSDASNSKYQALSERISKQSRVRKFPTSGYLIGKSDRLFKHAVVICHP